MPTCAVCGHESSDTFKFCPECGAPAAAPAEAREQRKTVTVLFCDVTGSTALGESTDPEALRALLARYFERMKGIVEAHGGTVEKFIGDAVMAVFGVPQVHEDDALRAVRAAVEMREALPELGVQARIGVNTGEVVTGTEERLATGDAVNVAARLEQAAKPDEILIGEETLRLVRDCADVEPVEPLELKGKSERVSAHRLVDVGDERERRHDAPMVGRERQQRLLQDAFAAVRDDRACHLFTVLGVAGVGKSRLVAEFLGSGEATVVRARCLSYGEGITYWPAVEILTQLGVRPDDESAAAAIRSVLGESDEPTSPDEIAWAVRKVLEQAAAEHPVVCVFDDLHWAEPALLDLVEHVADWSRDAPILLLCIARPELLDRRPGWAGGKLNATTVLLEPLSAEETDELIERLAAVDEELRKRIRESAEGNPLFVEEMLAMVRDVGDGEVAVPPTIQALLAARLDQLDGSERALLERGAVEGKIFHRGAVEALAPDETQVAQRLMALVRKELVRPDRAQLPGDDAFRFRHLLIRDAAYDALPKSARADLHERFARWLEEHGAALVELDEILGYHLEQAARYRSELGQPVDPELSERAASHLTVAGRRALLHQDAAAAVNLLQRAADVVSRALDVGLEVDLIRGLFDLGRGEDARRRARLLAERAAAHGDRVSELVGRLLEDVAALLYEPEGATERLERTLEVALPVFQRARSDVADYVASYAATWVAHMQGRMEAELEAAERAFASVRRLGWRHREVGVLPALGAARVHGTTPLADVLVWLEGPDIPDPRHTAVRLNRAIVLATLGRIDEARALCDALRSELVDRGARIPLALLEGHVAVGIEQLAGDYAAAIAHGEEGCRIFSELGEHSWLSTAAGFLAQAYYAQGDLENAERWAAQARELGADDDAVTQMVWRQAQAKVLARRGRHAEAERLAREAIEIGEATDMLDARAEAHADLGEVLLEAADHDQAAAALQEALTLYERKGNVVMTARTRDRLASLLQLD